MKLFLLFFAFYLILTENLLLLNSSMHTQCSPNKSLAMTYCQIALVNGKVKLMRGKHLAYRSHHQMLNHEFFKKLLVSTKRNIQMKKICEKTYFFTLFVNKQNSINSKKVQSKERWDGKFNDDNFYFNHFVLLSHSICVQFETLLSIIHRWWFGGGFRLKYIGPTWDVDWKRCAHFNDSPLSQMTTCMQAKKLSFCWWSIA